VSERASGKIIKVMKVFTTLFLVLLLLSAFLCAYFLPILACLLACFLLRGAYVMNTEEYLASVHVVRSVDAQWCSARVVLNVSDYALN
jgi:hypothetical protein